MKVAASTADLTKRCHKYLLVVGNAAASVFTSLVTGRVSDRHLIQVLHWPASETLTP